MQQPKIVFFDIDDTLYRKYTDTLRPSVIEAFKALKARGILTAIATGRPPVAFPEKIKQLIREAGVDMLVSINGQYIEFRGEPLQTYPLETAQMADLCAFLEQQNIAYAFVNNNQIAVSADTSKTREALAHILPQHPVDKDFYLKEPVYQMLLFYPAEQESDVAEKMTQTGMKTVRWHENAVDMLREEGSKARGIAGAIAKLGIDMADVMAFGDGFNDIEMLQTVGFGVAMGNGEEAAKAVAKYVCPSVDEDGVLRGLQALGVID